MTDLLDPGAVMCHHTRAETAFEYIVPTGKLLMNPYSKRAASGRAAAENLGTEHAAARVRRAVGWWFGTPRYRPFFEASILAVAPVG
jgi:hypothetical protein